MCLCLKNPKNLDFDSKNSDDVPFNLNEFLDKKWTFWTIIGGTLTSGKVFWMVLVSWTLLMALLAVVVVVVNFDEDEAITSTPPTCFTCYLNWWQIPDENYRKHFHTDKNVLYKPNLLWSMTTCNQRMAKVRSTFQRGR